MKKIIFIFVLLLLFNLTYFQSQILAKTLDSKITNNPLKSWNILFNTTLSENSVDENTIYILPTNSSEKHPVSYHFSKDKTIITVQPLEPFLIGESYTLVVTQNVKSLKEIKLKEKTVMPFKVLGEYIKSVQATLNPLVTNVNVQGTKDVAQITISVNGTDVATIDRPYLDFQFNRGILGLLDGDVLLISAYDNQGYLLEQMYYQIAN